MSTHQFPPLIITVALNYPAFAFFNDLRRSHFPAYRNHVPAHLTLFHKLPGEQEQFVIEALKMQCRHQAAISMHVARPSSIGRGVAYRIASLALEDLRRNAAETFAPWLTAQDRAPFRPHITVQNKVDPAKARNLLSDLDASFRPFDVEATGLLAWRYLRGPWQALASIPFCREVSEKDTA